jgi:antitoxin ParD1/3/4
MASADRSAQGKPPARPAGRLARLDASIRHGLADAEAGRTTPAEEVFERLERKYLGMAGPEK